MAFLTFILGLLAAGFAWGVYKLSKTTKYSLTWLGWAGITLSFLAFLFTVAWIWSCFLEGAPQAAGVGLLLFGSFTVVLGAITRIVIIKGIPASKRNQAEEISQSA